MSGRRVASEALVQVDPFIESVRDTSQARLMDRLARGIPTCCHEREDGLGFCAAGPEEWMHAVGQHHHAHPFLPTIDAGRAALKESTDG